MILWIFSSLVGTWGQSGALFIREISSGIKMDTEFFKNNESHTVILLFAERVHGKMRHNANNAGQASWRGKRSSPSSSWSSSFFFAWSGKLSLLYDYLISLLVHPKLPDKEGARLKVENACRLALRCISMILLPLSVCGKKDCHYSSCKVINSKASNLFSFSVS